MRTFQQIYCDRHRCSPADYHRRLFWQCLYPHAVPFAWLLRVLRPRYFVADDALIRLVADAVTMRVVREEVRDYFWDSNNRGWLRRVANLRVSGQRLKNVARAYLPESEPGLQLPAQAPGPASDAIPPRRATS
jgi:hypothetical protein